MRMFLAAVAALGLMGCGTTPYQPMEYPLRDGLIAPFDVAGSAVVTNDQPSADQVIVYSYSGSKLASNLRAITEVMVLQTQKELQKNGRPTGSAAAKTLALKVDSLVSEYVFFSWKSSIKFQATLGDGQALDFTVRHASGILEQDLNGCIAEGVMHLLNDAGVKAYLAT